MNFEQLLGEQTRAFAEDEPRRIARPQIVTLGFLSKQLPSARISENLAKSLRADTGASVVLLRLEGCENQTCFAGSFEDQTTVVDWACSESVLQDQFRPGTLFKTEAGFELLTLSLSSRRTSLESISSFLSQLSRHFHYVLIEVLAEESLPPSVLEFFLRSDLTYLFLEPVAKDVAHLGGVVREVLTRDHNDKSRLRPILCLSESGPKESFDAVVQDMAIPYHFFVRGCPAAPSADGSTSQAPSTPLFQADLRRLARQISGRLVGLALSSGAAKGFTHIGVIQVLEENGIEVDVVAGASIGAYIGALWTYGLDGKELERLARELEGRWGFWRLLDPVFPPRRGFLRGHALRKRLMRSIGSAGFADLARPLRVIAGNLSTLDRMVFSNGEVAATVHASMAVPGICVPVMIDGEAYIDGGIVDPVPVDVLREMGVTRVIAVNALATPGRPRHGLKAELESAPLKEGRLRKLFRKLLPLDKQLNYFAQGNLFEIVVRSVHGAQVRLADASGRQADLVLRPEVCDDRWLDCRNPGRFIRLGREVAERHLEEIKALAGKNEFNHDRELAQGALAAVA
jgi:NTE family protein